METIGVSTRWRAKEKVNGVWRVQAETKNLFTYYGLTQLAAGAGGANAPAIYLVIDSGYSTLNTAVPAGGTSVVTNTDNTITGDTQIVLGAGLGTQEVVTYSAKTGTGPYTYTLSTPTVSAHSVGEAVVRQPTQNDTVSAMSPESSYDSTYSPGQRAVSLTGYSSGVGNYVMQFYIAGTAATNLAFMTCGLSDSPTVGTGNLHNAFVLGYTHNSTNDIEIDGSITLTNI